jgi:GH24 family phage-related lysozyme (muramidase)
LIKTYKEAENYWGDHLAKMSEWRQAVILDMTYNCGTLRWPKLTKAIYGKDWSWAA